jgi:L-fuconolactonase
MIVDTHTHLYDPTRPQGIPWPKETDDLLYRTVLPRHFAEAANPSGVSHTVVVEASVWVADNDWILDLATNEPAIVGFVGNLDPYQDDYIPTLDRLSANPLFRGVRLRRKELDRVADPDILSAIKELADRDLEMDLLVNPPEMPTVGAIAKTIPDLRIVVNHVAHVLIDGNAPDPEWVVGLNALAAFPNIYMKVSGFVERSKQQPAPADPEYYKPAFDAMWDTFGEDRLVFGSNWPVCGKAAEYGTVFDIANAYFTDKGPTAREKYFVENGRAAYQWVER